MKPTLLAGIFGFLIAGAASAALMAQATQPLQQPNSEAAATVPAGELALGSVRVPKGLKADGKELPAGTYRVRLTPEEATARPRARPRPTSATSSSCRAARSRAARS